MANKKTPDPCPKCGGGIYFEKHNTGVFLYHAFDSPPCILRNADVGPLPDVDTVKEAVKLWNAPEPPPRKKEPKKYWTYTCRCEHCSEMQDSVVSKDMPYRNFQSAMNSSSKQTFAPCVNCGKTTLQTLVSYDSAPEEEEEDTPDS